MCESGQLWPSREPISSAMSCGTEPCRNYMCESGQLFTWQAYSVCNYMTQATLQGFSR